MWVFGYGSLMWNPGFAVAERRAARLRGYHRAYMMYSTRNRGTPDCPGMVLSLAPGGECIGMAMRVEPGHEAEALAYLDRREGAGRAHRRVPVPLHWREAPAGPVQHALTYLPILSYSNYIWGVPLERQAELVACGCGKIGTSFDYLRLLMDELRTLEIAEPGLERLFAAAQRCLTQGPRPLREPAAPGGEAALGTAGSAGGGGSILPAAAAAPASAD